MNERHVLSPAALASSARASRRLGPRGDPPLAALSPRGVRTYNLGPREILALQRHAGNRAVSRLVKGAGSPAVLGPEALERAVAYVTERRHDPALIKAIQRVVGVTDDGVYGLVSARATAAWQRSHGLSADGKVGPATLAAMGVATDGASSPGDGAAAPSPKSAAPTVTGGLADLMAKPRLTPYEIITARESIAGLTDQTQRAQMFEALQAKTTYHSQRDNVSVDKGEPIGDKMCNLTSLAMCLEYLGVRNPYPDMQYEDALEKIRVEKVGKPRTSHEGWGGVAKLMGVRFGFIPGVGARDEEWYRANVEPHLAAGEAVMLSIQGHICRLQAVTSDGLVADDPYGRSKLKLGTARGWQGTNKGSKDSNVGEDITWSWADVKRHSMKWIAWFKV